MTYLDANFFIYALLDQTKKGERAREIQKNIVEGKIKAYTSVLALDEIMWVLTRNQKEHLVRKVIENIYATPNLAVREVPSLTALRALHFMETAKLRPRDAFHTAIMEHLQTKIIISDDSDFDRVKEIKRQKLE